MRIQHNIMAMSAYRNYTNNVAAMKKNLEKLSSGYKINRAGDDAAGLAISEKMRAQISGLETAQKNAKDGISLVQTAEGALTEVHDMLNRMVELATQSANGTYDNDTDRYQLQKEMDQLRAEIDRIADSSNFNGIMLLDGSMDAGGDIKYTAGSFQFAAQHPAGIGPNYELPEVGSVLGTNTVLHTNGTKGGDTNAFSIDLENVELLSGKAIDISFGDVTITVTNSDPDETGKAVSAKDIVKAIAAAAKGDTPEGGITVEFDGAKVEASADGSGDIVFKTGENDTEFKLTANGSRLTFTQTSKDDGIDMPRQVTIGDNDPTALKVKGDYSAEITNPGSGSAAGVVTLDLSNIDVTAAGSVRISVFGKTYDIAIDPEDLTGASVAKDLADALATELAADASITDGGGIASATADGDGKITVTFGDGGNAALETFTDADSVGLKVEPTPVYNYQEGEPVTDTPKTVKAENSAFTGTGTSAASLDWKGNSYSALDNKSIEIEIEGQKFTLSFLNSGAGANDIDLSTNNSMALVKDAILNKLNAQIEAANEANKAAGKSYNQIDEITIDWDSADTSGFTISYTYTPMTLQEGGAAANVNFTGDYNKSTTVLETKSAGVQDRLASTYFDLAKLADAEGHIAEGTTITIGRDTYTFTYDTNKIGKDGYVVLDGGEHMSTLADAATKLTKAAENNGTYTVGFDEEYDDGRGRITITEKEGQVNFDLTTMEGIERSLGYKIATTNPVDNSKGLTLQIGDTAESYNQLKVNIKDCHTKALGIDLISIANQADAAEAVNAIKAAINYVSDVRGTLGATQNRLDHTINNLSVMTENIQDAESTIRDVDIAEEMMAYTKNNILIQSAQAMLAQANQVPQGVLQLLQ